MASGKGFTLQFDMSGPSEDGTLLALCRELPMIITAKNEAELRQRTIDAVNSLAQRLEAMPPGEDVKFLKEAGVKVRQGRGKAENRTMSLPLSLGVAPR